MLTNYALILANTGIRIGEARGLRWRDIDSEPTEKPDEFNIILHVRGKTGAREVVARTSEVQTYFQRIWELRTKEIGTSRIIESPRSCVFWGTTNSDGYLKDETGGRRFWPVNKIGKINVDLLRDWRDQLWAEAVNLYLGDVPWWLTKKETQIDAENHQRDRYVGDPWDKAIAEYVETASEVTMDEVLRFAVKLEIGRCGQSEMNRASRCLKSLGLSRVQVRIGDKRIYKYRKTVEERGQTGNVTPLKLVTVNER